MPTSSSSAAATPPADASPPANASSEETLSSLMAEELRAGDSVDFGVSRMSSVRVQDMQRLGYFGSGVARVPGTEEVSEPEGELVVFEAFFAAGLRLPAHRFVGEVMRRFNVQIHQLTPNAVVALSKYVWATTSYGGQPSIEVFAKYYCLHWQKRMIGDEVAQFGSCTFTPKTGKTTMQEVRFVLPDGVGKRGAVDAGRGRGYMVEGVAGKCVRQLWGCRLAAPVPFCLWWPSFRGSLWFGGRSLRHGRGSRIGAAAAHALDPYHEFHFRGPGGDIPGDEGGQQRDAGWRCCALAADCGRLDRSLAAESSSTCG
jgi:hypothetical protein